MLLQRIFDFLNRDSPLARRTAVDSGNGRDGSAVEVITRIEERAEEGGGWVAMEREQQSRVEGIEKCPQFALPLRFLRELAVPSTRPLSSPRPL